MPYENLNVHRMVELGKTYLSYLTPAVASQELFNFACDTLDAKCTEFREAKRQIAERLENKGE